MARRENSAQPDPGLPQWKDSLGDIQATAAALLAENNRLRAEYQSLDTEARATAQSILAQKEQNKEHALTLMHRQRDLSAPASTSDEGIESLELENAVLQKRQALQLLQARDRALENRVALDRIRVRELDLEKKSLLVDVNTQKGISSETLKAEIGWLRAEINKVAAQEKEIWRKIMDTPRAPDETLTEAQALTYEGIDLKQKLVDAAVQEAELRGRISELQARRRKMEADPAVMARNRQLEERRNLNAVIEEQQRAIGEQKANRNAGRQAVNDIKTRANALDKQNKTLAAEVENLRENIALLEYKISSLESGQDRNKKKGW